MYGGGSTGPNGNFTSFPAGFGPAHGAGYAGGGGGGGGIDHTFNVAGIIAQTGSGEPQARLHQSRNSAQETTRLERAALEHMPLTEEERSRIQSLQDIKQGWLVDARTMLIMIDMWKNVTPETLAAFQQLNVSALSARLQQATHEMMGCSQRAFAIHQYSRSFDSAAAYSAFDSYLGSQCFQYALSMGDQAGAEPPVKKTKFADKKDDKNQTKNELHYGPAKSGRGN